MFFRFATNYYNSSQDINLEKLSNVELYDNFIQYLNDIDFCTSNKSIKLIEQLKESLTDNEKSDEILNSIDLLEEELKIIQESELSEYQDETTNEIRKELAGRISGKDGRIKESLKNDKQFAVAVDIVGQQSVYLHLLAYGE
jgi:hypothetical protein